jgi:predicted enzyme related to lactoylglutathione lyase
MSIDNVLASVAVSDLGASVAWYGKLLGREPDKRPMAEVAEWKFAGGGWLQVYQLPERAGNGSFTLSVAGIEEIVRHVAGLGIDTSERTSTDRVRTLMITDPDGNHIAFAEQLTDEMAR